MRALLGLLALLTVLAFCWLILTLSGAIALYALSVFGLVAFTWNKAFWLGVLLSVVQGILKAALAK